MREKLLFSYFLRSAAPRQNDWLATQCTSHPSPVKFPANREFNRENHDFRPERGNLRVRNHRAAGIFRQIP